MKRKRSHEEFLKALYEINPNIEPIEEYQNNKTPIRFRCKICGHIWKVPPGNVLRGTGCRQCVIRESTKSKETLIKEVSETSPSVEIIGEYVNTHTPIKCSCKKCGYIWASRPTVLLKGGACPRCAGNVKKTHDIFVEEMRKANPDIEVIGRYVNAHTKIECRCKSCSLHFAKSPNELLRGGGCPNRRKHQR